LLLKLEVSVVDHLPLILQDLSKYEYLMGIITRLPNINTLSLWLETKGHAIAASVFHLLSICPCVRKLEVTLRDDLKVKLELILLSTSIAVGVMLIGRKTFTSFSH
jgi:hypothetical protein